MGNVRRRNGIRKSVDESGGESEHRTTGGNTIFDEQSGEHSVCDTELELDAIAGGQSGDAGKCDDSSRTVPTWNGYFGECLLRVQGSYRGDGNRGSCAGHGRNVYSGSGEWDDHGYDGERALGRVHRGIGIERNSGSVERCVGERHRSSAEREFANRSLREAGGGYTVQHLFRGLSAGHWRDTGWRGRVD